MVDLALAALGALVLGFAVFSEVLRRSVLSESLVALVVGVLLGPAVLGLLELAGPAEDAVLEHGARLTLAVALMALAMHLRDLGRFREWRPLLVLLLVAMPAMWLTTSLLAALLLGASLWAALLVGAIVTPTDPILAASIVTGREAERHLPERVRRTLLAESGANDGLAQLFVFLPLAVLALPAGEAAGHWLTRTLLWVSQLSSDDEQEEERVQEPVSRVLLLPIFALFGVALPWGQWLELGWAAVAFAGGAMLLRRLPVVALTLPLLGRRPLREALFLGWFGPIGISALLYAQLALDEAAPALVWPAASLVIAVSVVVHGVTAAPLTRRFGRHRTQPG